MEVTVAKSAGFCFGVKRAVNLVYEEAAKGVAPLYTYGPIIHNDEVIRDMQEKGITVIRSKEELTEVPAGTVIIRSHGVTRADQEAILAAGHSVIDATCPFVKKIHRIAEKYNQLGYHLIITGDPEHPEVKGIIGWTDGKNVDVISSEDDIERKMKRFGEKYCIVSQTTFNLNKFKELIAFVQEKGYDTICENTICDATEKRQVETALLAAESDAMIVIGDRNSSNTQKLFQISKKGCHNTYYIQTAGDMDYRSLRSMSRVGITAGASTPNYIIEEVSKNVRNEL